MLRSRAALPLLAVAITVATATIHNVEDSSSASTSSETLRISPTSVCIKLADSQDANRALEFANGHPLLDPEVVPLQLSHGFFVYALSENS